MRKPLARAGAAALALTMSMTALAACSPGGAEESGEPTTITMLVLGDKPTNGRLEAMLEKLNVRLEEEANADLELFYVEWADWQTQYNTQLLSGDDSIDLTPRRAPSSRCPRRCCRRTRRRPGSRSTRRGTGT
jgi:putative aldouronate transport system substrate-binding protein